jgi:tRNA (guanine37-N1)-methyltransferase
VLQNPLIKTVVNKTDKLHNVYRTPELELLAGEKDYEVEVREQGTRLRLDF